MARATLADGERSVTGVAKALGVGRTTLYRHLAGDPNGRPGDGDLRVTTALKERDGGLGGVQ